MPIESDIEFTTITQEPFHALDKRLMRHAFDIHNKLGRFCDEKIFQEALFQHCKTDGIKVCQEVLLKAICRDFSKTYYLDMVVEDGIIYELKAVEALNTNHEKQLINCLLLANVQHGKLINFRPASVESRFISTRLMKSDRTYALRDETPENKSNEYVLVQEAMRHLLDEWGSFLDVNLYREALRHFFSGERSGIQPVPIEILGRTVGHQNLCLLNESTAWHISSIRNSIRSYESHLMRLLNHTHLRYMIWINMNQRVISLKSLKNDSVEK